MPTYNERQNLEIMAGRIRESTPDADLLVVDDNSPDGTGDLADKLAETDSHVHVMHRTEKAGLGRAYVAGFSWALEQGYDVICEMDADGSHRPEDLPRVLKALPAADAVIGSRYVPGGTVVNWPLSRQFLSWGANVYTRIMLGVRIKDATGGFRAYKAQTLRTIGLDDIESAGYCFQIDMTLRVLQSGLKLAEVPITFVERERGASKMSRSVILESLTRVARWGISSWAHGDTAASARRKRTLLPGPEGLIFHEASPRGGTDLPRGQPRSGSGAASARIRVIAVRLPARAGWPLSALALLVAGVLFQGPGFEGPALLDYFEALGENRLKVFDGAALHEHVPVAARRLYLLGRRKLSAGRVRHGAADTAFPGRREFRLGGERHAKMVPVGAVEGHVLARGQVRVPVVLIAGCTESGSAKCAFGHYLLPPRRLAISKGNTGYPDKIPLA
jgi:dolichol-phosphate mannosyltransferase